MYEFFSENEWTNMPDLKKARYGHSCAILNDKIIVGGGKGASCFDNEVTLKSIEIISLPSGQTRVVKERFSSPRFAFGMVTVGVGFSRVLAFGGFQRKKWWEKNNDCRWTGLWNDNCMNDENKYGNLNLKDPK